MALISYQFEGRSHEVRLDDRTTIGRADTNTICIPEKTLSRHHALIAREGNEFVVRDLESRHGISSGREKVSELSLQDGMVFALGTIEFSFRNVTADAVDEEDWPESVAVAPPPAVEVKAKYAAPAEMNRPESVAAAPLRAVEDVKAKPVAARTEVDRPGAVAAAPPPHAVREAKAKAGNTVAEVSASPLEEAVAFKQAWENLLAESAKIIVGQKPVLEQILCSMFSQGHALLIGVPGLAKTLMVKVLASTLHLEMNRIQFTPDLMPADITGTDILEEDRSTGERRFRFNRGPLFANILLADEINRTPPKTQAALLEAMQEHRVTASGATHALPEPFLVLATQNPIEQEGTYPLPEAQLDRFMFCITLDYPARADEERILLETTSGRENEVRRVLDGPGIQRFQRLVRRVPVSPYVASYVAALIRATRPADPEAPDFVRRWVRWGAGTRAGQALLLAAKVQALLEGRPSPSCADVRRYAAPVLRHRIFANFAAASEGASPDEIVRRLLDHVKEPRPA